MLPDYYSFHVITGQVDETMTVAHVRTHSIYLERKDIQIHKMPIQERTAEAKHTLVVNYQLSIAHGEYEMQFQLLLHRNVKTQLMWPLVVKGYMMFHSNRVVARPGANLICGENRNH